MHLSLVPLYGRDYKSKAELLADWNANKDFIIEPDGKAINKEQTKSGDVLAFRYGKLRKQLIVNC